MSASRPEGAATGRHKPSAGWGLALLVALLIAYGSLYPFGFEVPPSLGGAVRGLLAGPWWYTSRGDALGNLLLFVPLGVGLAAARGPGARPLVRLAIPAAAALLFAAVLQVLQLFIPARSAAVADVVWNCVGLLAGFALAPAVARLPRFRPGGRSATVVPVGLAVLWVVAELAPLIPTIDWQAVKDAVRPLWHPSVPAVSEILYGAARVAALAQVLACLVGERRAVLALLAVLVAVSASKPFVVGQTLAFGDLLGYAAGCVLAAALASRPWAARAGVVAALLLGAYSVDALRPFVLRDSAATFQWVPFAAVLQNLTVNNLLVVARSLFTFAAVLWLIDTLRGARWPAAVGIALAVAGLESVQSWIAERSPDVTEPVIVLLAASLLAAAGRLSSPAAPAAAVSLAPVRDGDFGASGPGADSRSRWRRAVALALAWASIVLAIKALLRLPGIPYNVAELFVDGGRLVGLVIFVGACLWIGAGAAWLGRVLALSRRPWLTFAPGVIGVAIVSHMLLRRSVTYESLNDILGSLDVWRIAVVDANWGSGAQAALRWAGLDSVTFVERRVRFAALYAIPAGILAIAFAVGELRGSGRPVARRLMLILVSALPWFVLCKFVVIDWASTDNLTELIAAGPSGVGYLGALLALFAANAALLTRVPTRAGPMLWAIGASVACGLAGWQLLNLGLEPRVEKYGLVFSGVQFLLGPDRSRTLGELALFLRWGLVYMGMLALVTVGARLAWPVLADIGRSLRGQVLQVKRPGRTGRG